MPRALRILTATLAPLPVLALLTLVGPTAAATPPLVSIPLNINPAVAQSIRLGTLAGDDRLSFALSLRLRDETGLHQFLAAVGDPDSPQYRHFLTPAEFTARYGPSATDVATVINYLVGNGLAVTGVSANRQVVDGTGTVARVQRAFGTTLARYRQDGQQFYANDSAPRLPAAVAAVVSGISGLDNHAVRHTALATDQPGEPPVAVPPGSVLDGAVAGLDPASARDTGAGPRGYSPAQLRTAYDIGSLGDGAGQTVALWEFDGYDPADIAAYDARFGLTSPVPVTRPVDGTDHDLRPGRGQGEVELDIELVRAVAPAAQALVYEAPNSDHGQIDMANQIVSDDVASVVSISWGECESDSAPATIRSTDRAIEQGVAEGITFFSASGDGGSDDCGNGRTGVDYPASDPNVTGTGGTTLTTDSENGYRSEIAWRGSGGGVSQVFAAPAWQAAASAMRTVPDVAADADPNTGYATYTTNRWVEYGGTSCAAPLWSAFTALVNARSGNRLGNVNPALYAVGRGAAGASAFHDVTTGGNGAYQASPGYDDVTGWGSYNGATLAGALH